MSAFETELIDLGGELHVARFGGEGRPIVLVHGLGGNHLNWMRVGPSLSRFGRVIAPDLPGYGRTALLNRDSTVAGLANTLGRLIDTLDASEPAVLIGNSMGGYLSMALAAAAPEKVAGVVLVNPAVPPVFNTLPDPVTAALFSFYATPLVPEWVLGSIRGTSAGRRMSRQMIDLCCAEPERVPAEVRDAHVELEAWRQGRSMGSIPAFLASARSMLRVLRSRDEFDALVRAVQVPTLFVHGTHDRIVQLPSARRVAALRPDWDFQVYEGIGHVPMLEAPDQLLASVVRWMERLPTAAPATPRTAPAS